MFSLAFSQRATGPSVVCEGSDVTLQCVIVFIRADNTASTSSSLWIKAPNVQATTLPNHRQVFNSATGVATNLVITNVTLEDDNNVYICRSPDLSITSSVVLNVIGGNMCKCENSYYCWDECVKMNECSNDLFHSFCEDLFSLITENRLQN